MGGDLRCIPFLHFKTHAAWGDDVARDVEHYSILGYGIVFDKDAFVIALRRVERVECCGVEGGVEDRTPITLCAGHVVFAVMGCRLVLIDGGLRVVDRG
jgi:hypothetical protein